MIVHIKGTGIAKRIYESMPCIWWDKPVAKGEGAPAMPPLPALHSKCIRPALEASKKAEERR